MKIVEDPHRRFELPLRLLFQVIEENDSLGAKKGLCKISGS